MKLLITSLGLAAGCCFFVACGGNNSPATGSDTTTTMATDTTKPAVVNTADQDFIDYAVPGNTKEMIWLQAGIKMGHNKELKDHARMMLKDHQALDSKVSNYLSAHPNLKAPVVDTANTVDINDKKGADWDKAWTNKMVDAHSELLGKLQKSQTDVKDTALLSIINGAIPTVQSHLAMMKSLQSKLK